MALDDDIYKAVLEGLATAIYVVDRERRVPLWTCCWNNGEAGGEIPWETSR